MTRIATIEAHVNMDYPKENEVITSSTYTLRFEASNETQQVEVSIDRGPWQPCRQSSGYFWFDWSNYMAGRHEIAIRARQLNGQIENLEPRQVRVELER